MSIRYLLPRLEVRNTGSETKPERKHVRIPTRGNHGKSKYPDEVVAGVKFDLQRKTILAVSMEWRIDGPTVGRWARGESRLHVEPKEWPADKPKAQA